MINIRVILAGETVDLSENISMPLSYAVADIRDPSKKNTNSSKTIKFPGTLKNNKLFWHLFDTNVLVNSSGTTNYTPGFNPNKKAEVVILRNGSEQFRGHLKLDRITVLQDYKVEYECTCFGKLKDLMLSVGEKTLAELDLSRYNHPYTQYAQENSWNTFIYNNGVLVPFQSGEGYVYPMIDYALNNDTDYKVEHFYPAIYKKTLVREIINQAGFQVDGTIFDDADFKNLIVVNGSGNLKLSQSQVDSRNFRSSNSSTISILSSGTTNTNDLVFNDDSTPPNNDAGGNYNTSTGKFTCPHSASYNVTLNIDASVTHFPSTASASVIYRQIGWVCIMQQSVSGATIYAAQVPVYLSPGSVITSGLVITDTSPITSGATTATSSGALNFSVYLNQGDLIFCRWQDFYINTLSVNAYNQTPGSSSYAKLNLTTSTYFTAQLTDTTIKEGDTVDMNNVLTSTVKQREVLSSFFKLFNVYTEDDKYTPNLLHMNSRKDFFASSGTTRDWSKKLDISKPYTIEPMGDLDHKTYLYRFRDDGDYWNEFYKRKYNETYGQKKYDVDNDWMNSVNTTEVIYSPTPLVNRAGSDRVIPRIFQLNNNGQAVPKPSNLRLLYYGGVKNTLNSWNYMASSGTTAKSAYPYAGHLNNVSSPTFDVNFSSPIEVFYSATSYTDNNLFNIYYRQFIEEITDKDSRILSGYFVLNEYDIETLNFRDLFFILGDYWRLNSIKDYQPDGRSSTLCEFIKFKGGVPFNPTTATINGSQGVEMGSEIGPVYTERTNTANSYYAQGQLVSGVGNVVDPSARGIIINGDYNSIGAGANDVSILSTSGTTVLGGVQSVSIINSNDMTIDARYNGYTVINGSIYGGKSIRRKTASYKGVADDLGKYVLFQTSSNASYDLPEPSSIYNGWSTEIKNINNSGYTVTVNALTDSTMPLVYFEDGISTTYVLNDGEFFTFTYRSGFWFVS